MPRPRVYKTEAVVLRQRKLGEADRIVTLYTPEMGKVEAVAKGARKPTSRLAGHLEVLSHATVLLAKGQNLDVVTQAQALESFPALREDLERLSRAVYVAELVERATPERQENYPLYQLLLRTLSYLAQRGQADAVVRWFEVQALDGLGYRPYLDACAGCRAVLSPTTNYFSASAGGVLCPKCAIGGPNLRPLSVNALKVLRLMQGGDVNGVLRVRIAAGLAEELEGHLRDYVRYVLEREVKSAAFIQRLRHEASPGLALERRRV
ncbi:MAG: DNA repair protein RecO [Dehalococcoidia bacterium]